MFLIALSALGVTSCTGKAGGERVAQTAEGDRPADARLTVLREPEPGERHFARLQQLTFKGENAEAYYSIDGQHLIFQRRAPGEFDCDQIFTIGVDGSNRTLVSTGLGKTTCSYFFPGGDRILYSSTHLKSKECPPPPDFSRGYVWPLEDFDIFTAAPDGSDLRVLYQSDRYDAEATISRTGHASSSPRRGAETSTSTR